MQYQNINVFTTEIAKHLSFLRIPVYVRVMKFFTFYYLYYLLSLYHIHVYDVGTACLLHIAHHVLTILLLLLTFNLKFITFVREDREKLRLRADLSS